MTLGEALVEVWRQVLVEEEDRVEVEGKKYRVTTTSRNRLRTVEFAAGGQRFEGIEQNPRTQSRWAAMAREGKRVMQFRCGGRYVGAVAEGKLLRYPAWKSLKLPE
ncbi:MAG: hypothetical protein ACRD5W_14495 [Candidatus Acidiferrales bacterium]